MKTMKTTPTSRHGFFGFELVDDELLKRAYIKNIAPNSPASQIYSSCKATRRKIRGAFLISINNHPVFTSADAQRTLQKLQDEGVCEPIELTFAQERKLSLKDVRKAINDYGLFAPTTRWDHKAAEAKELEDPPFLDQEPINSVQIKNARTRISKILTPTEDDMEVVSPTLDIHTREITEISAQ